MAACIAQERRLRAQSQVVDGQRVVDEPTQGVLKGLARELSGCRREIQSIESEWGKDLHRLRRYESEWLRLQGKEHVCIDVELDQIMAYFRVALVNVSSWFLSECMGKRSMSLAQFLHNILLMPAEIQLTQQVRRIYLTRNPKDGETMAMLAPAIQRLNGFKVQDLDGRRIEFAVR